MIRPLSNGRRRVTAPVMAAVILVVTWPTSLAAQWISLPLPNTPRTAESAPDLTAPAPTTDGGQPDLSGNLEDSEGYQHADRKPGTSSRTNGVFPATGRGNPFAT